MTADASKTVFISYRRSVSSFIARAIFMDLREHGYDVFMDVESIDSGAFDTVILNQIAARAHFVLILTPGTLERCAESGDWLRREIEQAMDLQRNIVPLMIDNFCFNKCTQKHLTGKLADLPKLNSLHVPHDYFDAAMDKLRTRFLKEPEYGVVQPTPPTEVITVQKKIEEIVNQLPPTAEQLTAEQYVIRSFDHLNKGNYVAAIADCTEALRLNPQLAMAYNNRGAIRGSIGDYDGEIADCTEAIRLNPQLKEAYNNLGIGHRNKGDYDRAIANYTEAIYLYPQYADSYYGRGLAHYGKGDFDRALADYTQAILINPQDDIAYNDRSVVHINQGNYDRAISDCTKAIRLNARNADAYSNLGVSFEKKGDYKTALAHYGTALRINRNHQNAHINRDNLLKKMDRT